MHTAISPFPSFQLSSIAFFGRDFHEYVSMFDLDADALRGCRVLDVAAGPSAFTAGANARGIDAVAVDPLYGLSPDALTTHALIDHRRVVAEMRRKPELFQRGTFGSINEAAAARAESARVFVNDYEEHFVHGRYVGGALPELPFADGAFDTVLCAHLLFIYARQLDFDFHLAACRELARVSRGEVRIYPAAGADGQPYPEIDRLRAELAVDGIALGTRAVPHRFFVGSGTMLVLRRQAT
ncbi:MAG: methyltransferase [Verrucomicrobiota bacterium]